MNFPAECYIMKRDVTFWGVKMLHFPLLCHINVTQMSDYFFLPFQSNSRLFQTSWYLTYWFIAIYNFSSSQIAVIIFCHFKIPPILLKNKANLVHSRHRSIHNFIMNLCSALTAYCFFENKPEALPVYVKNQGSWNFFHAKLIPNSSIDKTKSSTLQSLYENWLGGREYLSFLGAKAVHRKAEK